jgi:transcriptional regulator with XRE-family HTH domain
VAEDIPRSHADAAAAQGVVATLPPHLRDALRRGPFHRALREAIACRGLSLAHLQSRLDLLKAHVGQSTLSYWQRGRRHPEMPRAAPTVRALEAVLNLPDGALLALLEPEARPIPDPSPVTQAAVAAPAAEEAPEQFADVLADWQADVRASPAARAGDTGLDLLLMHETVLCGADRVQRSVTTRIVVRAKRHNVDRYVGAYHGTEGARIEAALIRVAEGCRPGRIRRDAASQSLAVELLFDRRLAEGETHVFCYSVLDDSGGPVPGFHRTFHQHIGDYLLQLAFHRKALPVRCTRQFRPVDGTPTQAADLVYGIGGVASAYFPQVAPGRAGIAVEWS